MISYVPSIFLIIFNFVDVVCAQRLVLGPGLTAVWMDLAAAGVALLGGSGSTAVKHLTLGEKSGLFDEKNEKKKQNSKFQVTFLSSAFKPYLIQNDSFSRSSSVVSNLAATSPLVPTGPKDGPSPGTKTKVLYQAVLVL